MSGEAAVPAGYSLAAQCGSEIVATAMVIYLGESIIANELLAKTKGARMGWLAVALGFGMSFGVVIFMFGYISAHLNPATCLALWVAGKISFTHFLALAGAEFAGALIGAFLVFLHYVPHFKTVPEPMAANADELLLRTRDALSPEALAISSYNTRPDGRPDGVAGIKAGLGRAIQDVRYFFTESVPAPEAHNDLVEVALGHDEVKAGASEGRGAAPLRRRSVQVCDVHRRLKDMSLEEFKEKLHLKGGAGADGVTRAASINLGQLSRLAAGDSAIGEVPASTRGSSEGLAAEQGFAFEADATGPGAVGRQSASAAGKLAGVNKAWRDAYQRHVQRFDEKQGRLFDAAVVADQNAKLSIFATRPAIYTPVFNFLAEFMCTTALIFGALVMYARRDLLTPEGKAQFQSTEGMWIGFFVFVCILGLGGPTGIAANPARDFSPRLAHALLPIAGKGSSEWWYAWIPFWAPFLGGAAAGGLYLAFQNLNHSQYVRA